MVTHDVHYVHVFLSLQHSFFFSDFENFMLHILRVISKVLRTVRCDDKKQKFFPSMGLWCCSNKGPSQHHQKLPVPVLVQ